MGNEQRTMEEHRIHRAESQQHVLLFQDTELTFVLTAERDIYMSLPDICAALGINTRAQIRRIQRTPELAVGLRIVPLMTRGGRQGINCLHAAQIDAWLVSLQKGAVHSEVEERVTAFQQEIVPALCVLLQTPTPTRTVPPAASRSHQPLDTAISLHQAPDQLHEQTVSFSEGDVLSEEEEKRAILANIPETSLTPHLTVTSYPEDRAIREATLAQKHQWMEDPRSKAWHYTASNKLQVFLGDPDTPLEIAEALQRIRLLGESTALTARIILGLWMIRRSDEQLSKNGSAAIRADEILEWRGVQKHTHLAYPGSPKRYSDGYQTRHKQQVYQDLKLLQQCYLRGHYTMRVKGRLHHFFVDGPYLRVSTVKEQTLLNKEETIGYFVSPGDWFTLYEEQELAFFAEVDRRVFQLNPHNQQHELRLALYLTERWRQQARDGTYAEPIAMKDLLAASMIPIDKANLTNRFIPRIRGALATLYERGILGAPPQCFTEVDETKAHWGNDWLASLWSLLPPLDLTQRNIHTAEKGPLLPQHRRREP